MDLEPKHLPHVAFQLSSTVSKVNRKKITLKPRANQRLRLNYCTDIQRAYGFSKVTVG